MGLGWLIFRKSNSLALFGVKLTLEGGKLYLQRFLDKIDLSLGLLVNIGVGLWGKSVKSRKSLYIFFHLSVRIFCTVGWHLINWMHSGVGLSKSDFFLLGLSMVSLSACFNFPNFF